MTTPIVHEAMSEFPHFASAAQPTLVDASTVAEVFGMMSQQWERDFLFKCDANTDLTALTSPAQLQHAVLSEFRSSLVDASGRFANLFNIDVHLVFVVIPVFSVGAVSAEVVLQLSKTTTNELWGMRHTDHTFARLLRNDDTGDLLLASDDATTGETSLAYYRAYGTTARSQVWMCADRAPFHAAVLGGDTIDVARATRALSALSHSREFRACPLCGTPAAAANTRACACVFRLRRALHPLDYSSCRANMVVHTGSFCGSCDATLFAGGAPVATASHLISQVDVSTRTHSADVQHLCERAAKIRMQQLAVVPPALRERRQIAAPGAGTHPALRILFDSPCAPRSTSLAFSSIRSISATDAWIGDPLAAEMSTSGGFLMLGGPAYQKVASDDVNVDGSGSSSALSFSTSFFDDAVGFLDSTGVTEQTVYSGEGKGAVFPSLCGNGLRRSAGPETPNTLPLSLPLVNESENVISVPVDRQLERQIKNREAAARSNQRRKLKNDTLKLNLKEAHEKESELREIESKLKIENERLKRLLNK